MFWHHAKIEIGQSLKNKYVPWRDVNVFQPFYYKSKPTKSLLKNYPNQASLNRDWKPGHHHNQGTT